MNNPHDIAEKLARGWYMGMGLEYEGVDVGKVLEYDCLQIINKMVMEAANAPDPDSNK